MRRAPVLAAVRRNLRIQEWVSAGDGIVVGLSGGADSVALLDSLATLAPPLGVRLVAAHLDHGLREDSAEDAGFCAELCARLGVPFRSGRADVRARARRDGGGLEEAARLERYAFLRSVLRETRSRYVAVAHTRDDQAETLLLRLLRGSGRRGLSAMRARSGDVLRPMLDVSRDDVRAHLAARGLPWREDPSNADPALLRNRVRHELLPYLESRFNPKLREGLARTAGLVAEESDVLERLAADLSTRAARRAGEAVVLNARELAAAPAAVARLVVRGALAEAGGLRRVGSVHVDRVLALARKPSSGRRLPLPGGREALFRFGEVWIGGRAEPAEPFVRPLEVPGSVDLPGGVRLVARTLDGPTALARPSASEAVVSAPGDEPLVVRTRRPGDRVRAGGRDVSLKRYLLDARVPADVRAGLPLLASGHRVLWIAGQPAPETVGGAGRTIGLALERV
jgi:tRNA(Ile)-lysidine synthase